MATFKLNGNEIPFEPGDTIIKAAWKQGIEIPHYCWHPGLSVAANCRMCLVEIKTDRPMAMPILKWDEEKQDYVQDTKPKLQPACQMAAAEGMEVFSETDNVKNAQAHVQEFLLLNHPVDCPICDQAGECKLQDYWLDHQHDLKRKETEPVHKPKGVRFGPTIVYDAERCVMCTRCIRVCDELAHDHVLDMRERGNKNEIVLAPGRELDHDYTLMTEHVCPVGALTSRDFRFKARVWFLKSKKTICPGCSTGCNMHADYDPRYNKVYRLRPRDNMEVNKFWMCDDGMMTYKRIHEDRVIEPSQDQTPLTNKQAQAALANILTKTPADRIAFVLSAQASTEDNYGLVAMAKALDTSNFFLTGKSDWKADDILRSADQNPNRKGALKSAGKDNLPGVGTLLSKANDFDAVIVLGSDAEKTSTEISKAFQREKVVCLTSHFGSWSEAATLVVPICSWAETKGTFINEKSMAQKFDQVIPPLPGTFPAWELLHKVANVMQKDLGFSSLAEIRSRLFPVNQVQESSDPTEGAHP